jgi:glycosyltransferase involved in cell wall biosynthesis
MFKTRKKGVELPLVSVVLGSYNRLKFLKLTIETIREEIKNLDHELFVVDGGSSDGTLDWLIEQKDIIKIVQHNRGEWQGKKIERKPWGYFMNLGFKAAQGKYVCMLSDDCLVIPGAIKNGCKLFDKKLKSGKKIGAVAFHYRNWPIQDKYCVAYTLGNKLYVNHGLYLKEALEEVGYIDEENYFFYNGDGDLCLKMWQKGYECIASENSYIEHYPHANVKIIKSNHLTQQKDNKNYFTKWEGIFYDRKKHNVGKLEWKQYNDGSNTGELFKGIYEKALLENPKLLKKKRGRKNFGNVLKFFPRKIKHFFFQSAPKR